MVLPRTKDACFGRTAAENLYVEVSRTRTSENDGYVLEKMFEVVDLVECGETTFADKNNACEEQNAVLV